MKEQFTLVTIPMDWRNPNMETIVGIGLPNNIVERLGISFAGSETAELIREQFEKATGSEHDTSVLTSDALLALQMGDVTIVAGGVFGKKERQLAINDTTKAIKRLNSLNFGLIQE